jgi:hypothetical protein
MEQWKIDVIEVYNETSFKECVMYCTDENIITPLQEEKVLEVYDLSEDTEHEVVTNFFDFIGISEDEFLEIQDILEN